MTIKYVFKLEATLCQKRENHDTIFGDRWLKVDLQHLHAATRLGYSLRQLVGPARCKALDLTNADKTIISSVVKKGIASVEGRKIKKFISMICNRSTKLELKNYSQALFDLNYALQNSTTGTCHEINSRLLRSTVL